MAYTCPICPKPTKIEEDTASGNVICRGCGTILEEDVITAEVGFSELSNGATVVQGALLEHDRTRLAPRGSLRAWGTESREQTIQKAELRIRSLANGMGLHAGQADMALRYFKLALAHKFNQGRRSQYVVASCLYLVCRMEKTSHMLIDFSDKLKINLFTLGGTYLKLVKALKLEIPIIEPEIYIRRFARELNFGYEMEKVAKDATRLVQRMDRDWLSSGRRPAGLCGAALFIASRMNNFRRSVREIVYFVKVSDATVKKRIEEFSNLPSANLTVDEFREIWFQNSADPPSFTKPKRLVKADEHDDEEADRDTDAEETVLLASNLVATQRLVEDTGKQVEDAALDAEAQSAFLEEMVADRELEDEINRHLGQREFQQALANMEGASSQLLRLTVALKEEVPALQDHDENLSDLDDDDEVAGALIDETSEHFILRAQLWMESNREYLREQREKRLHEEEDKRNGVKKNQPRKRRKKAKKAELVDADSTPATPAESAKQMVKQRAFSKKIDYSAMDRLFAED